MQSVKQWGFLDPGLLEKQNEGNIDRKVGVERWQINEEETQSHE